MLEFKLRSYDCDYPLFLRGEADPAVELQRIIGKCHGLMCNSYSVMTYKTQTFSHRCSGKGFIDHYGRGRTFRPPSLSEAERDPWLAGVRNFIMQRLEVAAYNDPVARFLVPVCCIQYELAFREGEVARRPAELMEVRRGLARASIDEALGILRCYERGEEHPEELEFRLDG